MRILLVEDDPKLAAFVQQGLEEEGFEVDRAHNGEEALGKAVSGSPDLILLDFMLPKKTGIDVVTELRARGRHMPILMLTARDSPEDRHRCLTAGADDLLGKPFRFNDLLDRIGELVKT